MTWETPPDLPSDGVTGPRWARKIMGYERYRPQGRRHDFECRYSLYSWKSARKYFLKGVKSFGKWYDYARVPIFWIVLWKERERCKWTHPDPLPEAWEPWIDRGFE